MPNDWRKEFFVGCQHYPSLNSVAFSYQENLSSALEKEMKGTSQTIEPGVTGFRVAIITALVPLLLVSKNGVRFGRFHIQIICKGLGD